MYLATSNPNSLIADDNNNRQELRVGDLGERVIPKGGRKPAYYNPNYVNPTMIKDNRSLSPERNGPAGLTTNYGVQQKLKQVTVDSKSGQAYEVHTGSSIFAQGKGTGSTSTLIARMRTPLLVRPLEFATPAKTGKGSTLTQNGNVIMDLRNAGNAGIHVSPQRVPARYNEGKGRHDSNPNSIKNLQFRQQ